MSDIPKDQREFASAIADIIRLVVEGERQRCAVKAAIHSQYPVETDYDRGYSQARKDAAAAIRRPD